jgi:transcriptional regulator with XRE-family HTH domain
MAPIRPQNGYAVRDFRIARGMTVDDLSKVTGISTPHIRNIETENKDASDEHLNRLALALDVKVNSLRRMPRALAEAGAA